MLYGHLRTEHIVSRFFCAAHGAIHICYSLFRHGAEYCDERVCLSVCLSASMISAGADLEGMTRVTSHPPGAAAYTVHF